MTHGYPSSLPAAAAARTPVFIAPSASVHAVLRSLSKRQRPIVLGASGGIDSTAAMLLLAHAGVPTLVVHVHHHLRQDADADQRTVESQAKMLGLPAVTVHLPPPEESQVENISARSRRLRYDALTQCAERLDADVLTAHHADDLLETFIMRVERGAGLPRVFGLRHQMRWNQTTVIRPLLSVWKADLRALVQNTNFPWIEDSSNDSAQYARNYLRKQMRSLVEHVEKSPRFAQTLAQLAEDASSLAQGSQNTPLLEDHLSTPPEYILQRASLGSESLWIDRILAMRMWSHDAKAFGDALHHWCSTHKIMPRRDVIAQIRGALWEGDAMRRDIRGLRLTVVSQGLILTREPLTSESSDVLGPVELQQLHADRWTQVGTHRVRLQTVDDEYIVWARPWMKGDRFTSPHSRRKVGVRKRLARDGVSVPDRDRAIVVLAQPSPTHSDLVFGRKASKKKTFPEQPSGTLGTTPSPSTTHADTTTPHATIVGVIHRANQRLEIHVAQSKRLVVLSSTAEHGDPFTP